MQYSSATLYFLVKITKNEYFFKTLTKQAQNLSSNCSVVCVHTRTQVVLLVDILSSSVHCTVLQRSARKHLAIVGVLLFYRRDAVCDSEPA